MQASYESPVPEHKVCKHVACLSHLILASILQSCSLKICHVLSLKLRHKKSCVVGNAWSCLCVHQDVSLGTWSWCRLLHCTLHISLQSRLSWQLFVLQFDFPVFQILICMVCLLQAGPVGRVCDKVFASYG